MEGMASSNMSCRSMYSRKEFIGKLALELNKCGNIMRLTEDISA
jgi:hypothetical protein